MIEMMYAFNIGYEQTYLYVYVCIFKFLIVKLIYATKL